MKKDEYDIALEHKDDPEKAVDELCKYFDNGRRSKEQILEQAYLTMESLDDHLKSGGLPEDYTAKERAEDAEILAEFRELGRTGKHRYEMPKDEETLVDQLQTLYNIGLECEKEYTGMDEFLRDTDTKIIDTKTNTELGQIYAEASDDLPLEEWFDEDDAEFLRKGLQMVAIESSLFRNRIKERASYIHPDVVDTASAILLRYHSGSVKNLPFEEFVEMYKDADLEQELRRARQNKKTTLTDELLQP